MEEFPAWLDMVLLLALLALVIVGPATLWLLWDLRRVKPLGWRLQRLAIFLGSFLPWTLILLAPLFGAVVFQFAAIVIASPLIPLSMLWVHLSHTERRGKR